jgi:two-component system, NarL family, sensor histidine kinase DesK
MDDIDEPRAALPVAVELAPAADWQRTFRLAPPSSIRTTAAYWTIWMIWTPLIIPALVALFQSHPSPPRVILSLAGAAVFLVIYAWTAWQNARSLASPVAPVQPTGLELWAPVVAMILLSLALTQVNGWSWGGLFIFTGACVSGRLPTAQAVRVLVTLLALTLVGGWLRHTSPGDVLNGLVFIAIPSIIVMSMARTIRANRDLHAAHAEMARFAAVTEERLRIARDLHDLLGHNLSLIAFKSELAGRLIGAAPERAVSEVADVERVARTALQEVREAVAGYRQPTLASELRGAREMLAAAGIAYRIKGEAGGLGHLSAAVEAVLGWTVREGVTNIIRHSRARQCVIRVTRDETTARVEIGDDGHGSVSPEVTGALSASGRAGQGLRGLAERVAALGGHCESGARPEGGFRLAVSVPIEPRGAAAGTSVATGAADAPDRAVASTAPTERAGQSEEVAR